MTASISSARTASVNGVNMEPALLHGGDLDAARRLFPGAPEPFIDLSTGINPHSYPVSQLPADSFIRLPEPAEIARLSAIAAKTYGAPSPDCVVAAPGTQILLAPVATLLPAGKAAVLGPTYGEFRRAAALAGHGVSETRDLSQLRKADLAIVVNPNNPDGHVFSRRDLLDLLNARKRDGLLIVDEAFMEVGPDGASLCGDVERGGLVVLRSFGKFFGLAGIRLGFVVTAPAMAGRLAAMLGPWAVSGPAIAIGRTALADAAWIGAMRGRLDGDARRLDAVLTKAGMEIIGGTALFRLVHTAAAGRQFDHLGAAGILVRRFPEHADWLRIGLPGSDTAWHRLGAALGVD
jgi:cobalamin biosynthesis protein CobC